MNSTTHTYNEISDEVKSQASKIQKQTANPKHSIWVSASAGTGKTTVLTNRILALLLDGADPRGLLCLTFTKTGASEMKERITDKLMRWQSLENEQLKQEVADVHQGEITAETLQIARNLFNNILDIPQGLKIYTIHAFCQSILQRFPIEAGLSPNFEVIDDIKNQDILEQARLKTLMKLSSQTETTEGQALSFLYANLNADNVEKLLNNLITHRMKLRHFLASHDNLEQAIQTIQAFTTEEYAMDLITEDLTTDPRYYTFEEFSDLITNHEIIQNHKNLLDQLLNTQIKGGAKTQEYFSTFKEKFTSWIGESKKFRSSNIFKLFDMLLSTDHKKLKNYLEKIREDIPELDILAQNTINKYNPFLALRQFELTKSLLLVGNIYLEEYRKQKEKIGVLDFDDLISKTVSLMHKDDGVNWVMYKLDTAIQNLLVDEAQDTSPAQWELVKSLSKEFFNDQTQTEEGGYKNRTLFVVGDEKQSIYSFQGADRISFTKNKHELLDEKNNQDHKILEMQHNFRSAPEILKLVDEVFKPDEFQMAIQDSLVKHYAGRSTNKAYIELLPIYYAEPPAPNDESESEKTNKNTPTTTWISPVDINENISPIPKETLAEDIATKIHELINSDDILSSTVQTIKPSDIMILVRTNSHATLIESALKNKNVPVSGLDKVTLGKHLAIQDLISVAKFCLLTSDNLSLAEVLKSPLLEFSDQDLIEITAYKSESKQENLSMWQALEKLSQANSYLTSEQQNKYKMAVLYLEEIRNLSHTLNPYDFFSYILSPLGGRKKLVKYLGEQALQPLQMFLDFTLNFDNHGLISLQEFLYDFTRREMAIKREHTSSNEVKIFTVHGAKGMEAPIVFLPRANFNLDEDKDILGWHNNHNNLVPIIKTSQKESSERFQDLTAKIKDIKMQEELRLLYVALTRAKDRLYICGHSKKNAIDPQQKEKKSKTDEKTTWYSMIKAGLHTLAEETGIPLKEDRTSIFAKNSHNQEPCYSYGEIETKPQELASDLFSTSESPTSEPQKKTIDKIFYQKISLNETVSRPLAPSNILNNYTTAVRSPLSYMATDSRFEHGILIHSLLEYLPNIKPEQRSQVASHWLDKNAILQDEEKEKIINETLKTINTFPKVFASHGMSEMPIVGNVEIDLSLYDPQKKGKNSTHSINAIIDRVIEFENEILLVDFKTNRQPAKDISEVSKSYVLQLKIYQQLLSKIYPNKPITSYILWTEPTTLMEINVAKYESLYLHL